MLHKIIPLLILLSACSGQKIWQSQVSPKNFALKKMEEEKFSPEFVDYVLRQYKEQERDVVVKTNVRAFLKRADYDGHYSKFAVKKCRQFLQKHEQAFQYAEEKYGVSKNVIVSLLWVETKFGDLIGAHSVPSVYFSLLQSDHPDLIRLVVSSLEASAPEEKNLVERVTARAQTKSAWALAELKSVEKMYQEQGEALQLKGSYAGAFGLPQFIPTSYLQWARSFREKSFANLFEASDAITSIGNYLQSNGWKKDDLQSKREALFHYNRAEGYVNVVLKIAAALED